MLRSLLARVKPWFNSSQMTMAYGTEPCAQNQSPEKLLLLRQPSNSLHSRLAMPARGKPCSYF